MTEQPAPFLGGLDHVALSVTDLERSKAFYTTVLGLWFTIEWPGVAMLVHRPTATFVALLQHPGSPGTPFTETATGLDHLGFGVETREQLEAWQERFEAMGVTYTPIRDEPLGHHLNFRDPDGIALEISAPNDAARWAYEELRQRPVPPEEVEAWMAGLPDA